MKIITDRKILKKKSTEVKEIDRQIKKDMYNIEKFLKKTHAVGLAAIQIGIEKKIIAVIREGFIRFYINPVIVKKSKEIQIVNEGCLSFPNEYGDVKRFLSILINYISPAGTEKKNEEFYGFEAAIIQHEIDHINGIICIDKFIKGTKKVYNDSFEF